MRMLFPNFFFLPPASGRSGKIRGEVSPNLPTASVPGDGEQPARQAPRPSFSVRQRMVVCDGRC